MTDKKRSVWRLPCYSSIIFSAIMAAVNIVFYRFTKYLPLLLTGITVVMLTAVYLLLALNTGNDAEPVYDENDEGECKGFIRKLGRKIKKLAYSAVKAYKRKKVAFIATLTIFITAGSQVWFWLRFRKATTIYKMTYLTPVVLVVLFVVCIIFENWCSHTECDTAGKAILKNLRSAFACARLCLTVTVASIVIKLLGFYEFLRWANIILAVVICYATLFILLSLAVKIIRHETDTDPDLSIPTPLSLGSHKDLGVLTYLEKNTGITMRSLWSIKMIKSLVPYTFMIAVLLFWFSTGIVQIESYQKGAVYRFGKLEDSTLEPGIHLTLPWPIDKVKVYNTKQVNTVTIGYISNESTDNTWTGTHGSNEYRLLLGGGNELVSINLRIEYEIDDLSVYLKNCRNPEKLLEAEAYSLVTSRTIGTDLDSLISVDRQAFADSFRDDLAKRLTEHGTGLGIVSVVLESIHPPVEIASVYQDIIGAEIKAEKLILEAEAKAAVSIAKAEKSYDSAVNVANADSATKTAAAYADVSEFMAQVSADKSYGDDYRYYKYLSAINKAYGNAKLILVGEGIDSGNIYFTGKTALN